MDKRELVFLYELAFKWVVDLAGGDIDKVPRPRLLETSTAVLIDDYEWDDFEQVYTEIYLSLRSPIHRSP